jgi:tetrapyrrole methylase family protein/MazG family protein
LPKPNAIEAAVLAAGAKLTGIRVFDLRQGGIARAPTVNVDCDSLFVGLRGGAAAALKSALSAHYPPHHQVTAVSRPGSHDQLVRVLAIEELERVHEMPPPVSVFVPAPSPEQRATVAGLRGLMARLRSPDGCPWDREQDHRSLRRCLLEETHEALAAIDREDWQELAGELGDLLLQVLFHAQLAAERGEFDLDDVARRLRDKLVARHPHVFGDAVARDAETVLRRWEELKRAEGGAEIEGRAEDLLSGVAPTLPALDRAHKAQQRAAHMGFDWPTLEGPLQKLAEEAAELRAELAQQPPGSLRLEQEIGDLLFSVVNVARFAGVNAEQALRAAVDRFAGRFATMRKLAGEAGQSLEAMNLEQMDRLWERAKRI